MVISNHPVKKITFQGVEGAYSHLALKEIYPEIEAVACPSFEHAMAEVLEGKSDIAFIPVENSQWGRVADVHHLLPESDLHIVGEYFYRVKHKLLGLPNAQLSDITHVFSHPQALGQCRNSLIKLGMIPMASDDTAGSAKFIAEKGNIAYGAIASELAAELYGLKILYDDLEDASHNTTRFLIMRRERIMPEADTQKSITSFVFETRHLPAALYKVLGGFATNNVNMIRLESYIVDGKFTSFRFYAEIEGHPDNLSVKNAFEELSFFARYFKILGVYPMSASRYDGESTEK